MDVDQSKWSGEGEFTRQLVEALKESETISFVRVEDAPATRSEADYNFISNEIFVAFAVRQREQPSRFLGIIPVLRHVPEKAMSMADLEQVLSAREDIGPPDFADESMIQYLKTERIVPPYQTRGFKLVELIRIYETDAGSGR